MPDGECVYLRALVTKITFAGYFQTLYVSRLKSRGNTLVYTRSK
jgi:hypothetical protein